MFDGENIDDIVLLASSSLGCFGFPRQLHHASPIHSTLNFDGSCQEVVDQYEEDRLGLAANFEAYLLTCCSSCHKVTSVRVQKSAGKISMPACSLATGEWPPWNRTYSTSEASKEKHQKDPELNQLCDAITVRAVSTRFEVVGNTFLSVRLRWRGR